jgi:hypothetical protein
MHLVRQTRCLRVERVAVTRWVANSIATILSAEDYFTDFGPVAQLAERRFYTADVVRAIRTRTTNHASLYG